MDPLVSCIMPTYNRRRFVPQAIRYFLRQDYEAKELIVIDDGTDAVGDLIPRDDRIQYIQLNKRLTIGAKRNLACEQARGEIIAHWDDDDWMSDWRLTFQVHNLLKERTDICGLDKVLFLDPASGRAWDYVYSDERRPWVYGATLCYTKAFWSRNPFPNVSVGEDSRFVWSSTSAKILKLDNKAFLVALVHPGNTSPKQTDGSSWHPHSIEAVRELLGEDAAFYLGMANPAKEVGTVLVTAAYGIGDILRITPLIRVFYRLGYEVDVLLAPDYPDTLTLLEGAHEIRRLYGYHDFRNNKGQTPLRGLDQETYDIAVFTAWSMPFQRWVKAKRSYVFPQAQWLEEGDLSCVREIAAEVGWEVPLPEPFAQSSQRQFNLAPGTIALHPGCKQDWPWKKWHGFEDLSRLIPEVVLIGTESDLDNANTYFRQKFVWPGHVKNFIGNLSLRDTAALLRQCAALVSNDSGMMQLGVAVGIPTFGIFGITSPEREAMAARNMVTVTKGLPCESECRKGSWGRRDCERHLECLRSLSAEAVLARMNEHMAVPLTTRAKAPRGQEVESMEELGLVYYGYVFDASGYGHAARAYIHALHGAGIHLSVVDLASHSRQVRDELVESLVGRNVEPDFHLFHGIPPQWARLAFSLPNAIGMTVWETDRMPTQWRNILSHVLEVWLPCEFNVSTFRNSLDRPIFKLPHPLLPLNCNGDCPEPNAFFGTSEADFVFYSIFEWQDRKSPQGMIEAYLRAFPDEPKTVLIIKANSGAREVAHQMVEHVRRQLRSQARIEIRCEAWSEGQIKALHDRGDCYVSLHRGEGWCYPLFEAAAQGTPVIATGFSGPMEYLNPEGHNLVKYELIPVNQRYLYYNGLMRWAVPDISHASGLMKRVYSDRKMAKERAVKASEGIKKAYSLEAVGAMARERLVRLLKRTQPKKWAYFDKVERTKRYRPQVPIPAEWFDEAYFEKGLKSNWEEGYTWSRFSGLFHETAVFLTSVFEEAQSFLDVGCAKGFLVRALRERGKECWGFDYSPWAVERVEESVKPFVMLASVDDANYDRPFDILTAFSILESLTETQVFSFLSRARAWTKQAILATIPSYEDDEAEFHQEEDRDLSHITIKPRKWWHELILKAGWRQDSLHKLVQQVCQNHELPKKMGWRVYVYAP